MSGQLTAETLARLSFTFEANIRPDPNTGPATWDDLTDGLKELWLSKARYVLASPEFAAHNEAIRRETLLAAADAADADLNLAGLTGAWLRDRAEAAS